MMASTGYADEFPGPPFTFDAFGTLGAVYQNARGLDFRRSVSQGHGARAGEVDLGTDTRLGLQVTGRIATSLDAQVQGIVLRDAEGVWRPELTRAFVRYVPTQAITVRAGRIGLEVYLLSDALDVGYSYLTIRPPVEVYGMLASDEFDGADVTFSRPLGGGVGRMRVLGGNLPYEEAFANGSVVRVDNITIAGITTDYLYGDWQTQAAVIQLRVPSGTDPVASALAQTGFPQAVDVASELNRMPENSYGLEIGASYDGDSLRAAMVFVHLNSNYLQGPKFNSAFALLGYRAVQLTPYVAFAMTDSFATVQPTGLPSLPIFEPLIAAVQDDETASQAAQRDLSLGVRYDFAPHMDLKAQIDRVWLHRSDLIFNYNVPPPGHASMTVFGVAFDFAF
ncbi:MAG: hypothetical protein ACREFT_00135 [Acetobacteraceae bacterium]